MGLFSSPKVPDTIGDKKMREKSRWS